MKMFPTRASSSRSRRLSGLPVPARVAGWVRNVEGAAIVEFALVSMPFFLLLLGIMQTGLVFFEEEVFQTAVSDAARLVDTGQAASLTQSQFKNQVCAELPPFIQCGDVAIDVRSYSSFSSAQAYQPVDAQGNYDPTAVTYDSGSPNDIMVVTGLALQPVLFPIMSPFMSNAGNGKILITVSAAFRNEPFGAGSAS